MPTKYSSHILLVLTLVLLATVTANAGWGRFTPSVVREQLTDLELPQSKTSGSAPTLGNYPAVAVNLSGNATITPDEPPTNTTSIGVETTAGFTGQLTADPVTGIVRVTNAQHANMPSTYTVTVRAFGNGATASQVFALMVGYGSACEQQSYFTSPSEPEILLGSKPISAAIADLNNDGIQDIVTANYYSTVSIRLGNGSGGFTSPAVPEIGLVPNSNSWAVAIGDFNGDGNQDIAVTNQYPGPFPGSNVSIRLGNGNGGFTSPATPEINVGRQPQAIAVGDFNSDGRDDLAVTNYDTGVAIRLGDGNGGFILPSAGNPTGIYGTSIVIADFNRDGHQDIATASGANFVSIRLGDGTGGFTSPPVPDVIVGGSPRNVAIGDFNGDSIQDFVATLWNTNKVSIRLGDGTGGFTLPATPEVVVGPAPYSVAIGDFNNDGFRDFAATHNSRDFAKNVTVRLGNGSGGFAPPTIPEVSVVHAILTLAIGDFDGDGRQDLVTDAWPNSLSIRLGACSALTPTNTATPTPTYTPTPSNLNAITAFDAALISRYDSNLETFDSNEYTVAEVSGEGIVGITDFLYVGFYAVNNGQTVGSTGTTVSPGLMMGDVSGAGPHFEGSAGTPAVSLPTMTTMPGTITVPVSVGNLTNLGAISYEFQVTFDPAVLQPVSYPINTTGTLSSNMTVFNNASNPGHLIVAGLGANPLAGSGNLVNLVFNVVGTAGQSTALTFEDYTDPGSRFHKSFFFNEGTPSVSTTNGNVTVVTATSTPTNTATATPTVAPGDVPVSLPMFRGTPGIASIPITVNDVTGKGLLSYDLHVRFDPSVITPASPSFENAGTISSGMAIASNSPNPGHLIIGGFTGLALTGSGTLLNLRFNIVGSLGQSTYLNFENYTDPRNVFHPKFMFNEGYPTATTTDGRVTVWPPNTPTSTPTMTPTATPTSSPTPNSATISGNVTYNNAIGNPPSPRNISNVTLNASGAPPVSTVTNSNGSYLLSGLGLGSYTITLAKNCGVNGSITSFDAAKITQYVAGISTLNSTQLFVSEVSGNAGISSLDAAMLARFASGPPYSAPGIGSTATWIFLPTARTYQLVGNVAGENYNAFLMGDVSGNWTDSAPSRPTVNRNGPERSAAVAAPHLKSQADKEILIPIKVQGAANKGIIAYEFDLRYDASVIRPQDDPVDLIKTVSRGLSVFVNSNEPGLLKVVVYGPIPIEENGLLLNLRFIPVGASGSVSPLTWERFMFNEGEPRVVATDGKIELF